MPIRTPLTWAANDIIIIIKYKYNIYNDW
jgi:hypothetical protein